jgi:lysine-specific demethylase 8
MDARAKALAALERAARGAGASTAVRVAVNADASEAALASARALAHDALHRGSWADADECWRGVYAAATVAWARRAVANGRDEGGERARDALRALDLAAMLGGAWFRDDVRDAIADVRAMRGKRERPRARRWSASIDEGESTAGRDGDETATRRADVSMEAFYRDFMAKRGEDGESSDCGTPIVLDALVKHWPAVTKWRDGAYLDEIVGDRTVPVELGKTYVDDAWSQKLMTMREFMDAYVDGDDDESTRRASGGADVGYLAQHELFEQCPELKRDIEEPLYCALGTGTVCAVNAWFGPAHTESPAHTDPHHNLLCQVIGVKRVRLFAPSETPKMYPRDAPMSNTSRVDVMHPNLDEFPLFVDVEFIDATLYPGDALYIPPGWWHRVKAATVSFSVSYWWD